jgi:hypothetical protein
VCQVGGPIITCVGGAPQLVCQVGGPYILCKTGPGLCGTGGPEIGCLAGPPLLEGVIDPGDLVKGELIINLERISPEMREKVAKLFKKLRK